LGILESDMKVKIIFYASLQDKAGKREWEMEIPEGMTYGELKELLSQRFPAARKTLALSVFSSEEEFINPGELILPDSIICVLPPVSGGTI
jgi:molybdopterin converting factor small subunit